MMRIIPIEVVIIWYLGFMKGTMSFEETIDFDPDIHYKATNSPQNYVLKYFLTVFFCGMISAVLYGIRMLAQFYFTLP